MHTQKKYFSDLGIPPPPKKYWYIPIFPNSSSGMILGFKKYLVLMKIFASKPLYFTLFPSGGEDERDHLHSFFLLQAISWQLGLLRWSLAMGESHLTSPFHFPHLLSLLNEKEIWNGFLPLPEMGVAGLLVSCSLAIGKDILKFPVTPPCSGVKRRGGVKRTFAKELYLTDTEHLGKAF